MKVVFIAITVENLAIEFLSGFLKEKGHEVDLVFDPRLFATEVITSKKLERYFDITKELAFEISEIKPDLVGFSVFTFNYQRCLQLAREFKKINKNVPVVFGGIHPTCVPELVIRQDCVDIVCVGEGEYALLELLESLKKRELRVDIKNLWFKKDKKIIKNPCRPLISDLDSLPFPDKELFYKTYSGFIENDYYTASSRGCPFACTYCANNVLHKVYQGLGKPVRRRSPKNMVDELVWAKSKFPLRQVTFVDDVFVEDVRWLRKFSKDYKKRVGLPYLMITHPLLVTTEIVKLLIESGCYFLLFGIQSASERTRRNVLSRYESNADILRAAEICNKAKLKFSVDHIFNIPTEGVEEQVEALKLYNEMRPTTINSYWLQYFPRTEIIKTAVKEGIIKKQMVSKIEGGLTSTSVVVGIGNKDTFNPDLVYANFQFLFLLLPIMPKAFTNWVINHKIYRTIFKPPMILNVSIKFLISIFKQRGSVYGGIIKSTTFFIKSNLVKKFKFKHHEFIKKVKNLIRIPLSFYFYRKGKIILPYLPNALWIEPTNICNLKCIMCPNSIVSQNNPGYMDIKLFEKIIEEIKDYISYIVLCVSGESLLHKDFVKMVKCAKKAGIGVYVSTNCTVLTPKLSRELLGAKIDWINFSFDGCTKKTYEKIRVNANFEKSLKNVIDFLKIKKEMGVKTQADLQILVMDKEGLNDYKENISEFKKNFTDLPLNCIQIRQPSTWGGYFSKTKNFEPRTLAKEFTPCSYLWSSLTVLWDGRVVACCSDFFGTNILGNFPQKKLKEIWNDKPIQDFRQAMISGNYLKFNKNCNRCDSLWEKKVLGLPSGMRGIDASVINNIFKVNFLNFFKKLSKFVNPDFFLEVVDKDKN